ncbi:hypothetical protein Lser_V15G05434 [Lactuca serriola]
MWHTAQFCKILVQQNAQAANAGASQTYYGCGEAGHFKSNCLKARNPKTGEVGRVLAIGHEEAVTDPTVVTGAMAGFHLSGDPYFPNQGNAGCIVEEPEEDSEDEPMEDEEPMEEEESIDGEEDEDSDGTDSEPEVYNPHPAPIPPQHFQYPTPNGPKLYINGAEIKVNDLPMTWKGVSTISTEEGQPTEPSLS